MLNVEVKLCTVISCILFVNSCDASKDMFFNDLGGLTKGLIQGIGNMAANQADYAIQRAAQPKNDNKTVSPDTAEKQKQFWETNDYFILKNNNNLYKYDEKVCVLTLTTPPALAPNPLIEGNIYYIAEKYYIYSEKGVFEPAMGFFKQINLEDDKIYTYKGIQCKFNKGKLHAVQDNKTIRSNTEEDDINVENSKKKSIEYDIKQVKNILKKSLKISRKSKIFDISNLNFSKLNDEEYNLITNVVLRNKQRIKAVILYVNKNNKNDKENNPNQCKKFIKFCKENSIKLYTSTSPEVNEFIRDAFDSEDENKVDLLKYDMGVLNTAEILSIYTKIVEMIEEKVTNDEGEDVDADEMQVLFSAKKVNSQCKTNLKIIMSLAKKYKKYLSIKIKTKNGVKTIK